VYSTVKIKAVGADLDGTLLPKSKIITPFTLSVISKLKGTGIIFFPVTGKALSLTKRIFKEIEVPMVALEGAYIHVSGKDLWDSTCFIEKQLGEDILTTGKNADSFLISNDTVYTKGDVPYIRYKHWACNYGGKTDESNLEKLTVIVFLSEDRVSLKALRKDICKSYGNFIVPYLSPVMYFDRYYLTIRSLNISKYRGSVRLLSHFNISTDEMLFLGDWRNDIPMLKRVGFPVAMRNAEQDVARYAKAVTLKTNEEDGVAHFLNGFFNLKFLP